MGIAGLDEDIAVVLESLSHVGLLCRCAHGQARCRAARVVDKPVNLIGHPGLLAE
jgi:hypothetical protein